MNATTSSAELDQYLMRARRNEMSALMLPGRADENMKQFDHLRIELRLARIEEKLDLLLDDRAF